MVMQLDHQPQSRPELEERLTGVLLGTALGDALGLPAEGMSSDRIARRFGRMDRFRMLGGTGFVSDDTEQAALVAQSLARFSDSPQRCAADFRRALVGWFWRLPWGIGMATIKACLRASLGIRPSGVPSAGNGAAMRAAVIGVFFREDPEARRRFGWELAAVTHTDERALEGALFVAELAAECAVAARTSDRLALAEASLRGVAHPGLRGALERAVELARANTSVLDAAKELGTSGYVLHTVPFALFCFLRLEGTPLDVLAECIGAGGDTDSIAAILGGWLGALYGDDALPGDLIAPIHDGPFGPTHLRELARALASGSPAPGYFWPAAMARNLLLIPVVLAHGFRRLLP